MNNFGTNPHILHRADATDTSVEAAYEVDTTRLEGLVYSTIHRSVSVAASVTRCATCIPTTLTHPSLRVTEHCWTRVLSKILANAARAGLAKTSVSCGQ